MARGRMIDKRISKSEKFANLKYDRSRVLYFMILPHLDVEGRFSGDPKEIKEDCCPRLKYSIKQIAQALIDLDRVNLLNLYEADGRPCIEYTKYEDFQIGLHRDREAPSRIPAFSGLSPDLAGLTPSLILSLSLRKLKEGRKESKEDIAFNFDQGEFLFITEKDKEIWKKAFPACDINLYLHQMAAWLLANPNKIKENYKRFIVNWLKEEQQRGGTRGIFLEDKHKAAREGTLKQFRDGEITYEEIVEISKKYNEPLLLEEAEKIRGSKK